MMSRTDDLIAEGDAPLFDGRAVRAFAARADQATAQLGAVLARMETHMERQSALWGCLADEIIADSKPGPDRHESVMCTVSTMTLLLRKLDPDACPADLLALVEKFEAESAAKQCDASS